MMIIDLDFWASIIYGLSIDGLTDSQLACTWLPSVLSPVIGPAGTCDYNRNVGRLWRYVNSVSLADISGSVSVAARRRLNGAGLAAARLSKPGSTRRRPPIPVPRWFSFAAGPSALSDRGKWDATDVLCPRAVLFCRYTGRPVTRCVPGGPSARKSGTVAAGGVVGWGRSCWVIASCPPRVGWRGGGDGCVGWSVIASGASASHLHLPTAVEPCRKCSYGGNRFSGCCLLRKPPRVQ